MCYLADTMERHLLIGSEDVRTGGLACERGGADMVKAAYQIEEALRSHQWFLDEWLYRYQAITEAGAVVKENTKS